VQKWTAECTRGMLLHLKSLLIYHRVCSLVIVSSVSLLEYNSTILITRRTTTRISRCVFLEAEGDTPLLCLLSSRWSLPNCFLGKAPSLLVSVGYADCETDSLSLSLLSLSFSLRCVCGVCTHISPSSSSQSLSSCVPFLLYFLSTKRTWVNIEPKNEKDLTRLEKKTGNWKQRKHARSNSSLPRVLAITPRECPTTASRYERNKAERARRGAK